MQLAVADDIMPSRTQPSEDCLVLNVWRPAQAHDAKLPVMVWIYGGGFVNGATSPAVLDGSQFARRGVVLVSLNYRVGRFGFFAHPALSAANAAHPGEALGNYAFMDQLAALRWVQRNIAAFDGDPGNVTVFGESAGGGAIHVLITSPLAAGLFQKAIVESGGGRTAPERRRYLHLSSPQGRPSAEQTGLAFAHSAGIDGQDAAALAALRALPAQRLVAGLNMSTGASQAATYAGPMIDGRLMTAAPDQLYRAGKFNRVALLIGANNQDAGAGTAKTMAQALAPFAALGPAYGRAAEAAFDPPGTGPAQAASPAAVALQIGRERAMLEPARFVARAVAARGMPVWEYRFSYVAKMLRVYLTGAPHASEVAYVFDTMNGPYGKALTAQDEQVAQLINAYWIAFASTGNPNDGGRPYWAPYDAASDRLFEFSAAGAAGSASRVDPWQAQLDLVEKLADAAAQNASAAAPRPAN
jgi:para-nitrobenzyl esterase